MIRPAFFYQLENLAWFVFYVSWVVVAIACFRLSKRGADKTFAISAWLAVAGAALIGFSWMIGWGTAFIPGRPEWIEKSYLHISNASNIAYFGHLVAFAVGAFRTAARLPARPRTITGAEETPD